MRRLDKIELTNLVIEEPDDNDICITEMIVNDEACWYFMTGWEMKKDYVYSVTSEDMYPIFKGIPCCKDKWFQRSNVWYINVSKLEIPRSTNYKDKDGY